MIKRFKYGTIFKTEHSKQEVVLSRGKNHNRLCFNSSSKVTWLYKDSFLFEVMRCPYCLSEDTKVVDKRDNESITKRRRECLKCEKRFNTLEALEKADLRVIKKDGRREAFDREKLKRGILTACEKRPVNLEEIEKMITMVEEKIQKRGKEVNSSLIGEFVSQGLKNLDSVAYIRFASVYREFRDLADFKKEIKELNK